MSDIGIIAFWILSKENFHVVQVIQSRSFALPGGKAEALATRFILPLADFFNHGGDTADFLLTGPSTSLENVR